MLNKVILIGNVGSDPVINNLPSGGRVANFSLATGEYWTDKNGQKQSRTEWHKIVVYNEGLVKLIDRAVHKGSKLYIEGMIKSRKYTSQQDGVERTIVEVVLKGFDHTIKLLSPKQNNDVEDASYSNEEVPESPTQEDAVPVDDDIPF